MKEYIGLFGYLSIIGLGPVMLGMLLNSFAMAIFGTIILSLILAMEIKIRWLL